jgi:hypothetical protein
MTAYTPKHQEIIPPRKSAAGGGTNIADDLKQPISTLKAQLTEGTSHLPAIARFSVGIKRAMALARVANYETDVMARGAEAIIEQHVNAIVDEARQRFFIDRSSQSAALQTGILEYSTRAKSALADLVHNSHGGILRAEKQRIAEIDRDLSRGEIHEARAEDWRAKCFARTDSLIDGLERDSAQIVAGLERDLETTLRSFAG